MSGLLGGDADSDSRPRSAKAATKAGRRMKREQEIIIVEMIIICAMALASAKDFTYDGLIDVWMLDPTFKLKEGTINKGTAVCLLFLSAQLRLLSSIHTTAPPL